MKEHLLTNNVFSPSETSVHISMQQNIGGKVK